MQATITYLLSQQAQRAQMMATGQPVALEQTVVEDIPAELLTSPFCKIDENGTATFDLTNNLGITERGEVSRSTSWTHVYAALDAQPSSGLDAIRIRTEAVAATCAKEAAAYITRQAEIAIRDAANRAREAADEDARAEAILSDLEARRRMTGDYFVRGKEGVNLYLPKQSHPRYAEVIAELERRERVRQEREAAKEAEKTASIDAFVAASGDESLIQQHADGLLCRKSVITMLATSVLDAAGLPAECPDSVVCDDKDCPCQDTSVQCLPREIYAVWQRYWIPEESTVEFREVRNCLRDDQGDAYEINPETDSHESAGPVEYHAIVTIPSGPFRFTRRIHLAQA